MDSSDTCSIEWLLYSTPDLMSYLPDWKDLHGRGRIGGSRLLVFSSLLPSLMHPKNLISISCVLCRECPQWTLWAPNRWSLICCMCFYRDPNYSIPILIPRDCQIHPAGATLVWRDDFFPRYFKVWLVSPIWTPVCWSVCLFSVFMLCFDII